MRSLQDWIERSGISEGRPINRHGKMASTRLSAAAVAEIVKRYAGAVGMDPTEFAGHSLRVGPSDFGGDGIVDVSADQSAARRAKISIRPLFHMAVISSDAPQPLDKLSGIIERVTYFNEETGFAVLRVLTRS